MKPKMAALFIGVLASFFAPHASSQDSREINKSLPLKANGELSIDTYKGSITISTWDKPEVAVYAKIQAEDEFESDVSSEKVRDTEVLIDGSETHVSIKTDYDRVRHRDRGFWSFFNGDWGSLPSVHYTIQMPATANLTIKDYKSKTSVKDLHSSLEFNTYKGDGEIEGLDGSLDLETYKGDIKVGFRNMRNHNRCKTYKGSISLTLPKTAGFDLDADVGRRTDFDTNFDIDFHRRDRHSNRRCKAAVNGGGADLLLESSKGDVRLFGQ